MKISPNKDFFIYPLFQLTMELTTFLAVLVSIYPSIRPSSNSSSSLNLLLKDCRNNMGCREALASLPSTTSSSSF